MTASFLGNFPDYESPFSSIWPTFPQDFLMSRELENRIPDDFRRKLCAEDLTGLEGRALLLLTIDKAGFPHSAMLSYREMAAPDPRRIRFAIWKGTTTSMNIRREPRVSLIAVDEEMSYYLKGRTRIFLKDSETFAGCSVYEFTVETVLEDREPQLPITGGIKYRNPQGPEPLETGKEHLRELMG